MRILSPTSLTWKGGKKAVLLLHGFTGTTLQIRLLGTYLHKRGYTVHAPLYRGHGSSAETLLQTTPQAWWQDAYDGFAYLEEAGHEDIAVIGMSMGGLFACRLAETCPVSALITMCTPMQTRDKTPLLERLYSYATVYKELEGKARDVIDCEVAHLRQMPFDAITDLSDFIEKTKQGLSIITTPTLVMQGRLDEAIYQESAELIYETVSSRTKAMKWYEASGHVLTMEQEKKHVCADVAAFLQTVDH